LIAGETARIWLVSTDEALRDAVGEALAGRAGDHRLYWVSQPELAAGRATDLLPHVIVVDDALGGTPPSLFVSQLGARIPGAAILVLLEAGAFDQARESVLAGARGFVIKPLQPDEFIATLRQVVAARRTATPATSAVSQAINGRIIVFCAPKGGTGRTTMAINTAVSLHSATREPVALVDADYAAPALDVALNLQGERTITDLLPRMSQLDKELVSGVLADHASGIRVLLAPPPADLTKPISLPQVQHVMSWLKRMFPWVLVDLGLPLDETSFAFLDGADRIIMSVLPEMIGLRNTRLMLDQLHERGYPDDKIWLILNRAGLVGGVSVRDIESRLHVRIKLTVPDDQPLATLTVNRGVPAVLSHRRSALAKAYQRLGAELANEMRDETLPASTAEARAPANGPRRSFLRREAKGTWAKGA
jgi:pilus assembly protein CpaE